MYTSHRRSILDFVQHQQIECYDKARRLGMSTLCSKNTTLIQRLYCQARLQGKDTPQGLLSIARTANRVVLCARSHFKSRTPIGLDFVLTLPRDLPPCEIHFPISETDPVLLPHEVTRILKSWYFLNLIEYTYRQDPNAEVTNNGFLRSLSEEVSRMPTTQVSVMEDTLLGLARDLESLASGRELRAVDPY